MSLLGEKMRDIDQPYRLIRREIEFIDVKPDPKSPTGEKEESMGKIRLVLFDDQTDWMQFAYRRGTRKQQDCNRIRWQQY